MGLERSFLSLAGNHCASDGEVVESDTVPMMTSTEKEKLAEYYVGQMLSDLPAGSKLTVLSMVMNDVVVKEGMPDLANEFLEFVFNLAERMIKRKLE